MQQLERKSRNKAEKFLTSVVKQDWDTVIGDVDFNKIEEQDLGDLDIINLIVDWPLRLEAFTYLANRSSKLIPDYAVTIRLLWNKWIRMRRSKEEDTYKIFWPTDNCGIIPSNPAKRQRMEEEGVLKWLQAPYCDIESHISMFRAKECLSIGGFDEYFDEAIKMIIVLISSDEIFSTPLNLRFVWHIMRSPFLKSALGNHMQIFIPRLLERISIEFCKIEAVELVIKDKGITDKNMIRSFVLGQFNIYFWSTVSFFLALDNSHKKSKMILEKTAKTLIKIQYPNGSYEDDIVSTCLSASVIHLSGADPSGSTGELALKWLIEQQNEDGSWNYPLSLPDSSLADNTLATVLVLETIDLVLNEKPPPIWAQTIKSNKREIELSPRVQPVVKFPIPESSTWNDVTIRFLSNETVQITVGEISEGRNFAELGFVDRRNGYPDQLWNVLKLLAFTNGDISWETRGLPIKLHNNLKAYIKDIRKRLKNLFQMEDDPFESYRKHKSYKTKFKITVSSQLREDIL